MSAKSPAKTASAQPSLDDFIFASVNSRVIALDRYSGEIVWDWKSPKGAGFVCLLLDGDRLVAGANGYLYCLNPWTGEELWENPLRGKGTGVNSLVSVRGSSGASPQATEVARQAAAAAAASSSQAGS